MPHGARLLLIDGAAVAPLLQPADVPEAVREAFLLHSRREGRVFPVVREPLPTGGIFGIESGDVPAQGLLGFKAAGFWPADRAAGGIGLQRLARPDSTRACVFGTGVQARVQLDYALRLLPALCEVAYVAARGRADPAFEAAFGGRCRIAPAADADAAVAAADIVITATPGAGPLFDAAAVQPGTHLNCVGADTCGKRELPAGLLERARLFVDDRAQATQIGEAQWAPDTPCDEIGDITVFDMTDPALQDLTVARLVHQRALAAGTGTAVAWSW